MDKTDTPDPRMRAYLAIDRKDGAEGSHSATAALHRRPATRGTDNRRAVEYARIDRGRTT